MIDIRHPSQGIESESQQMRTLDVPYFNLPVTPNTLDHALVNQFDTLLTEYAERPIIAHCQSGNRAGLLWAVWLKERGESSATANAVVSSIVTKAPVRKMIQEYSACTEVAH